MGLGVCPLPVYLNPSRNWHLSSSLANKPPLVKCVTSLMPELVTHAVRTIRYLRSVQITHTLLVPLTLNSWQLGG